MLCSICKKNTAIVFYNKEIDAKSSLEGYCYDCAKEKGINASEVIAKQNELLSQDNKNLDRMSKQFESLFKDLSENLNIDDLKNIDGAITFSNEQEDNEEDDDEKNNKTPKISGTAIPLRIYFF